MNRRQTISIRDKSDIIEARSRVRTLARKVGLDLFDQARISLATSTLAIILGMERTGNGQIVVDYLDRREGVGVQVICIASDTLLRDLPSGVLEDAKRMVDELRVDATPATGAQVTLIKWGSKRDGNGSLG